MTEVDALVSRLRRKAAALERNEKTPYVADVMRQAADALSRQRAALKHYMTAYGLVETPDLNLGDRK